jgi:predicted RNase H-like nuclease
MIAVGLDGYKHGWVAVTLDADRHAIDFIPDISWLATQRVTRAAIDIPIGLSADGTRACDLEARALLRPHASRVFTGARRWLWDEFRYPDEFAKANAAASDRAQSRVSLQLWHLGPKIMQVDAFVRAHRALDIRETHPELVFWRLNGNRPLPSKRTAEGLSQRRDLLRGQAVAAVDSWVDKVRIGTGAKADDVLDACACALAARDPGGCVPRGEPPRDDHGLPMRIWY